jgi:hypothetical protein
MLLLALFASRGLCNSNSIMGESGVGVVVVCGVVWGVGCGNGQNAENQLDPAGCYQQSQITEGQDSMIVLLILKRATDGAEPSWKPCQGRHEPFLPSTANSSSNDSH